jgi:hypothetical protein
MASSFAGSREMRSGSTSRFRPSRTNCDQNAAQACIPCSMQRDVNWGR